jgi:transposase
MVGRDRPYGCKGYDNVTRTRFFNQIAEGKSVEQAAFRRVSRSTGFRWRSRISELGHAQAHPPGGGRPLKHSKLVAAVIYLFKRARPELTWAEMHELIFCATGEKVTEPTFSRELGRLNKIKRVSMLWRES